MNYSKIKQIAARGQVKPCSKKLKLIRKIFINIHRISTIKRKIAAKNKLSYKLFKSTTKLKKRKFGLLKKQKFLIYFHQVRP